ncbi:hypothetical protein [Nocardia panacis]|uniref:hypothetical protein n=1 Tax=Nocardia panacis TaxID=2340916 RepID=UPI0011C3CA95|nr:hypothetical protein [Nocardia panacis]
MAGDGYDADRRSYDSQARGRIFENGTGEFFRDRERGYTPQVEVPVPGRNEVRRFDKAQVKDGAYLSIEDKSGAVRGPNDMKEMRNDRILLERGIVANHTLRTVEGEYISKEAREFINEMLRDFPGRYVHQVISREEARQIWARGLQREPGQQLELVRAYELNRAERARQRLEHIRQIVKAQQRSELFRTTGPQFREATERGRVEARERAEHARETREQEQARQREQAARMREQLNKDIRAQAQQLGKDREVGRVPDADRLYETHKELTRNLDLVRDQEREETRAMLGTLGLGKEKARDMELAFELSREEQRKDVVRDLNSIALAVRREDQRREAAEKERKEKEAREAYGRALEERGIRPEIAALVQLQQAPGIENERERESGEPPQAKGRSRDIGGRGIERTRD